MVTVKRRTKVPEGTKSRFNERLRTGVTTSRLSLLDSYPYKERPWITILPRKEVYYHEFRLDIVSATFRKIQGVRGEVSGGSGVVTVPYDSQ